MSNNKKTLILYFRGSILLKGQEYEIKTYVTKNKHLRKIIVLKKDYANAGPKKQDEIITVTRDGKKSLKKKV